MLGNGRLEAMCFDGTKRLAHIRGKLRKKVRFVSVKSSSVAEDADECAPRLRLLNLHSPLDLYRYRSGSTKATSFCSRCVITRTTRRMSLGNIARTMLVVVRPLIACSIFPQLSDMMHPLPLVWVYASQ